MMSLSPIPENLQADLVKDLDIPPIHRQQSRVLIPENFQAAD